MKITCVMVSSVDGKITRWGDPKLSAWTSPEDKKHFASVIENAKVIIMGRKTYAAAKDFIKHTPGTLRIIVTSTPNTFADQTIPGQLEFTSETPKVIVDILEKRGYTEAVLAGGGELNTAFFKANLVHELVLTVEPKMFGSGQMIVGNIEQNINLMLMSVQRLNKKGTLLLHYQVIS